MRTASLKRSTAETTIEISLTIDGEGKTQVDTGIGFFDHMLTHIGKHSLSDLKVEAKGDLEVDCHHTVEDTGIVLGEVLKIALGNKEGITRYGHAIIPMEEALILCAVDISGRPYVDIEAPFTVTRVGDFDTEMVEEFFRAVAIHAGLNLHIQVLKGKNNHHIIEGMCKAFAKAMLDAMSLHPRVKGVPSTKGILEV
ncbi:imidazoleglycerol-phosphate dehydratase [Sporanaerobium hydrogeniformans]|uniref:Imidazoleglycerol-phosphate dehydratase n=1 Tax=Sporanaerobium hydrogeniformans TaxID=3072179 RepID=A0AC61DDX4_9FIRM|nr:imidazoleglycerol-phosphate dehydratase HisB [Sporanaerobium hydrogeniformans]PHV71018.1 imidazoleglycerol-phosphate dehydratase [Sporanaerobium hydrogeniformans]